MGSRAEINRGTGHREQMCPEGKEVRRLSIPSLLELGFPSHCLHFCACERQLGWAVSEPRGGEEQEPQAEPAAVLPCCTPPVGAIPMV